MRLETFIQLNVGRKKTNLGGWWEVEVRPLAAGANTTHTKRWKHGATARAHTHTHTHTKRLFQKRRALLRTFVFSKTDNGGCTAE